MEGNMATIVDCKAVLDMDGFWTEYTMYTDGVRWWCVFGDRDVYGPDECPDWECDTEDECREWFDCYDGFAEEVEAWC